MTSLVFIHLVKVTQRDTASQHCTYLNKRPLGGKSTTILNRFYEQVNSSYVKMARLIMKLLLRLKYIMILKKHF
jgi:hypothetical protein